MPDDTEFEINFSAKSPSIYVETNIAVTEETTEEFSELGSFGFTVQNVYEENDCYDGKIEIRMSDHDFGGFTRFSGYGAAFDRYVSYEKNCINYVYQL